MFPELLSFLDPEYVTFFLASGSRELETELVSKGPGSVSIRLRTASQLCFSLPIPVGKAYAGRKCCPGNPARRPIFFLFYMWPPTSGHEHERFFLDFLFSSCSYFRVQMKVSCEGC